MTDFNDHTRHEPGDVARRMSAALSPVTGDLDHPQHDQLVAFVDQQLDAADREWIDSHLVACAMCAEDVADLRGMQYELQHMPVAGRPGRRWLAYGSIAAAITLLAWAGGLLRTSPVDQPTQTTVVADASPAAVPAPSLPSAPSVEAAQPVLTTAEQEMVSRALESGTLQWPVFHEVVRGRVGTLLGETRSTAPLTPGTPTATATTTARPRFAWSAGANVTSYEVAVFDEQFNEIARSGRLTTLQWTPARDLPRGQVLAWQITATTPSGTIVSPAPPQPEARFVVLSVEDAAQVAAVRERLATDPLALGLRLAEFGLYRDAEAALTRAASDTRYNPAQVQRILTTLRNR